MEFLVVLWGNFLDRAQSSLNAIRGHVAENACASDPDFACEVAFWSCLENSLVEVVIVAERLIHAPKFRGTEALQGVLAQRHINSSKNTKECRYKRGTFVCTLQVRINKLQRKSIFFLIYHQLCH